MKPTFDWKALVSDCGGATRALEVVYVFRAEVPELADQVRACLRPNASNAKSSLADSADRLQRALEAVCAPVAAELAARLRAIAPEPGAQPFAVWMKLCAELGRVEAAMNGVDLRAA